MVIVGWEKTGISIETGTISFSITILVPVVIVLPLTCFSCLSKKALSALVNPGLIIAADSVAVWLVFTDSAFTVSSIFPFNSFDFFFFLISN